jgi:hypothetical protein
MFGPHDYGPAPLWASALLSGISLLWWIGLPLLLVWAGARLLGQRQSAPPADSLLEPVGPSASEMLRRRYVMGEIDAHTFEQMLERVMFSEEQERSGQRLTPRGTLPGVIREAPGRVRIWEPENEPHQRDERVQPDQRDRRDLPPPPPPTGNIEMV